MNLFIHLFSFVPWNALFITSLMTLLSPQITFLELSKLITSKQLNIIISIIFRYYIISTVGNLTEKIITIQGRLKMFQYTIPERFLIPNMDRGCYEAIWSRYNNDSPHWKFSIKHGDDRHASEGWTLAASYSIIFKHFRLCFKHCWKSIKYEEVRSRRTNNTMTNRNVACVRNVILIYVPVSVYIKTSKIQFFKLLYFDTVSLKGIKYSKLIIVNAIVNVLAIYVYFF